MNEKLKNAVSRVVDEAHFIRDVTPIVWRHFAVMFAAGVVVGVALTLHFR